MLKNIPPTKAKKYERTLVRRNKNRNEDTTENNVKRISQNFITDLNSFFWDFLSNLLLCYYWYIWIELTNRKQSIILIIYLFTQNVSIFYYFLCRMRQYFWTFSLALKQKTSQNYFTNVVQILRVIYYRILHTLFDFLLSYFLGVLCSNEHYTYSKYFTIIVNFS